MGTRPLRTAVIAIVLTTAMMACSSGTNPVPRATGTPKRGPTLRIVEPADGAIAGASITVRVVVGGFKVVNKLNQPAVPGQGHIHFYLDRSEIPTTKGQPSVTAKGTYHAGSQTSHTWTGLKPGPHSLAVQLVNNDHTPLDPPVVAAVTVTVR